METYRIRYLDGQRPSAAIELVQAFMGVGLREARRVVDGSAVLLDRVTAAEARRIAGRFAAIGAQVDVEPTWRQIYAYAPRHPERGAQPLQRLRVGERELAVETGGLGRWQTDSVERFDAPELTEQRVLGQLRRWTGDGLSLAASELSVLEAVSARDERAEAQLRAEPHNVDAHLVYGDWLQAQGDPRGQLVGLQHALERAPAADRPQLRTREQEFRGRWASHLLGPLQGVADRLALRWSLGLLDAAAIAAVGWTRGAGGPMQILPALLGLPVAARLQRLELAGALLRRPGLAEILAGSPVAAGLRELELGDPGVAARDAPWRSSALAELWPQLPRLRRLTVEGGRTLAGLASDSLEILELRLAELGASSGPPRRVLASARLPRWQRVCLVLYDSLLGPLLTEPIAGRRLSELLAELVDSPASELELVLPDALVTAPLVELLAATPGLTTFDVLDLGRCVAEPAAVERLRAARERGRVPARLRAPRPVASCD